MDNKEQRIKELEDKLSSPAGRFYLELKNGLEIITKNISTKKLNLVDDTFQKSILILAQSSDKIFAGIEKGMQIIDPQEKDEVKKKKLDKSEAVAI